jgi:hypothetical protein
MLEVLGLQHSCQPERRIKMFGQARRHLLNARLFFALLARGVPKKH